MTEITTYLALGTNLGYKKKNLEEAILLLNKEVGSTTKISPVYTAVSMGFEGFDFYNCCIEFQTCLKPLELLDKCKAIEQKMGRVKTISEGYENRVIDIDIIFYSNEVFHSKLLNIPHKEALNRSFVLCPLADIAPTFIDPVSGISIKEAASKLGNELIIAKSEIKLFG
jgi:2-amino-4-hydroxy-6-hydroxymethyldihydropteridine diphosphokinase